MSDVLIFIYFILILLKPTVAEDLCLRIILPHNCQDVFIPKNQCGYKKVKVHKRVVYLPPMQTIQYSHLHLCRNE